jgi:hypothetical protein
MFLINDTGIKVTNKNIIGSYVIHKTKASRFME